ncbi:MULTISPECIES: tetratricopeptide repeat protein [unclassified Undibacterium]|uniref:tetratricopeptide repeat protein n=1 Tax=unclassified Undibacterium TaxID=2630295 RepID=UPI002AC8AD0C|nr:MULTISPECIES: tetratricopeptide repeat protein [unclassified Undibacterium]MEB0140481.1 tetratricopeptide repeat protein [Undibacterium sp. CCC2.1]MEB0173724.1 tetratricopeptide repeat protein [Undibacterium sp. CCC1.1]MEB0177724.1 tetratricopeptide repeat protein [Undibacterium sp. CCC3.4]MEB0217021.1 tetratricopeptide repeat protein [Undibacterium sp. 5I2]WPX44612.1 tetratricopeptide repeat protein [Undibacterium sp. CCC3.4]
MSHPAAIAEQFFLSANQLMASGDSAGAARDFHTALTHDPDCGEAWANLGYLKEQEQDFSRAAELYRRALTLLPDNLQLQLNLGTVLLHMKQFSAAETLFRHAVASHPESAAAWSNLGVLLACCKHERAAEQCYQRALAIDVDYQKARFNLSYILLRQGRFEAGWAALESRSWQDLFSDYFSFPRWRGESLLEQRIVIVFEGGHGDMIHFCRYADTLKERGAASVSLICHPALTALFTSMTALDQVFSYELEVARAAWDYWVPPASLPGCCGTQIATIPAAIPYLYAEKQKAAAWAARLGPRRLRVGLVWQGNPWFENNADRSIATLALLRPLLEVSGVQFVSLQKGEGEAEAQRAAGEQFVVLTELLSDFSETAALIENLDLVISVDSAVAHLAGALGKPCWLLLPDYRCDWRWMSARSDTPWYPLTRLFRQAPDSDWGTLAPQLASALREWQAQQAAQLA